MAVIVKIPSPMRRLTNGESRVTTEAATVAECLRQLGLEFPGLRERICEDDGTVRQFVVTRVVLGLGEAPQFPTAARVVRVISSHARAGALDRARRAGVATTVLADSKYQWFYWIGPVLALSFLGWLIMMAAGYYVRVLRPKWRGQKQS